ncbi:MAG: TAXI family TRAP transporter solute-binding subunit [Fuerstia sp.]|nr:TAXI family TRAP transporter solute-binding subunit [Fuerstiella sp.]
MRKLTYLIIVFATLAVLIVCVHSWYTSRETLPREIRLAGGKPEGLYHTLAQHLAKRLHEQTGQPARVIETDGSEANVELLRNGGAELGLLQAVSLTPEGIRGIAPLFPEPLHLLVRKDKGIRSISDLAGRRVTLGPLGSGSRQSASTVLNHYQVPLDSMHDTQEYFGAIATDADLDAALFTTGWMNPTLEKLLQRNDLELVGIADAEGLAARYPWFTATTIPRGLYPGKSPVPAEPVRTIAVTALLVGRADASDRLVRETLEALYETDLRASFPTILTAKVARDYDAAVMHPAVSSYHDPSASLNRLASALEVVGKSREAILGAITLILVVWGWARRRRERSQATADQIQKEKLDDFIAETLDVELQQMEVTDPEGLRPFLRCITKIKQEALRQLTSEKVRGDQLFAIFLSQCAALSEKIQMRMLYGRMSEQKGNTELGNGDTSLAGQGMQPVPGPIDVAGSNGSCHVQAHS